jgi:hypothetical protein
MNNNRNNNRRKFIKNNVALRTGQNINWDAEKMKVTNVREAGKYIEEDYRET